MNLFSGTFTVTGKEECIVTSSEEEQFFKANPESVSISNLISLTSA